MAVHSKTDGPDHAAEPDPFEFSSAGLPGSPPAMCAADDVFLAGKILPFGASPPKRHHNSAGKLRSRDLLEVDRLRTICAAVDDIFFTGKIIPSSDSPPKRPQISAGELLQRDFPKPNSLRRFWRGAAGSKAGYRRLRKVSDCNGREFPEPASSRPQQETQRPRWFLFVLGSVRVPETMYMDDIRNRQRRRSLATEPGGDMGRGTLRLLRSLSCRRLESATVVAAPPSSFASRVNGA